MPAPALPPRRLEVVPYPGAVAHHWLGGRIHVYDAGALSRYAFSAAVDSVPPGGGPAWCFHTREEKRFLVRSGRFRFRDARTRGGVELTAGDLVKIPGGGECGVVTVGPELPAEFEVPPPGRGRRATVSRAADA